jgi:hypothetical protein
LEPHRDRNIAALLQHVSDAVARLTVTAPLDPPGETGSKRQKSFLLQIENVEVQGILNRVFCPVPSQVSTSFPHPKSLG